MELTEEKEYLIRNMIEIIFEIIIKFDQNLEFKWIPIISTAITVAFLRILKDLHSVTNVDLNLKFVQLVR